MPEPIRLWDVAFERAHVECHLSCLQVRPKSLACIWRCTDSDWCTAAFLPLRQPSAFTLVTQAWQSPRRCHHRHSPVLGPCMASPSPRAQSSHNPKPFALTSQSSPSSIRSLAACACAGALDEHNQSACPPSDFYMCHYLAFDGKSKKRRKTSVNIGKPSPLPPSHSQSPTSLKAPRALSAFAGTSDYLVEPEWVLTACCTVASFSSLSVHLLPIRFFSPSPSRRASPFNYLCLCLRPAEPPRSCAVIQTRSFGRRHALRPRLKTQKTSETPAKPIHRVDHRIQPLSFHLFTFVGTFW